MTAHRPSLSGVRVLLIEKRTPAAAILSGYLQGSGATVVGPISSLMEAAALVETAAVDVAVLEIDLGGVLTYPVARALRRRGIPVIFIGALPPAGLPPDLAGTRVLGIDCASDGAVEVVRQAGTGAGPPPPAPASPSPPAPSPPDPTMRRDRSDSAATGTLGRAPYHASP